MTDNLAIRLYANKSGNWVTFRIKTGYYPELVKPETIILLGSTKIKVTKDETGANMPHLQITKVVLALWNIINND